MKQDLFSFLTDGLLRGGLLLLAAPPLMLILNRCTAALRHQVCACALILAGLLPGLTWLLPAWKVVPRTAAAVAVLEPAPVPPRSAPASAGGVGALAGPMPARTLAEGKEMRALEGGRAPQAVPAVPLPAASQAADEGLSKRSAPWSWKNWAALVWALGFAACACGLAWSWLHLLRLTRAASDWPEGHQVLMELGGSSRVTAKLAAGEAGPLVWGFFKPVVLLPGAARGWTAERLRVVLAHELAHVRRRDCLVQFIATVCAALHWCNPLAWVALRRLLREAEHACDDTVLVRGDAGSRYAEHLLAVATGRCAAPALAPSMARPSALRLRIAAVLNPAVPRQPLTRRVRLLSAAAVLLCGLPLALAQLAEEKKPKASPGAGKTHLITVKVTAVNEAGERLAGAYLKVLDLNKRGALDPFQADHEARTGSDGGAELHLKPGMYQVSATQGALTAGQGEGNQCFWNLGAKEKELKIRMVLGRSVPLVLQIVDATTGKAVPDARAILETGLTGTADAGGRLTLTHVPPGEHTVKIHAPPFADKHAAFNTAGKKELELKIEMVPGFEVRGVVRDEQGRPVKDAVVRDYYSGSYTHCNMRRSLTDAEGRYQLGWYARSSKVWLLGVEHPEYAKITHGDLTPPAEGSTAVWNFTVNAGLSLEGQVLNEQGQPVAGASVRLGSSPSYVHRRHTTAGADGRFRITKIATERREALVAQAKGHAPAWQEVMPGQKGAVTFKLSPGLKVQGRVLDRGGKPLAGVTISPRMKVQGHSNYVGEGAETGKDGRFEMNDIPAKDVSLQAHKRGYSPIYDHSYDPAKPVDLVMDAEGVLIGKVVDAESGEPVTAFNVRLDSPDGTRAKGEPFGTYSSYLGDRGQDCQAQDGRFVIEDLVTRAHYKVHVTAPGHAPAVMDKVLCRPADDPQWPAVVKLSRGTARSIRVTDAETGQPLAGVEVYVHENPGEIGDGISLRMLADYRDYGYYKNLIPGRTGPDGVATVLGNAAAGTPAGVILKKEGYALQYLPSVAELDARLSLVPETRLSVNVKDFGLVPGNQLRVASLVSGKVSHDLDQIPPEGLLRVGGLGGGKMCLRLDDEAGTVLGVILDLKPEQMNELKPDMVKTVPLKVRVLLDEQPADAEVYLMSRTPSLSGYGSSIGWARTDLLGGASFPRLSPVKVEVIVHLRTPVATLPESEFRREVDLGAAEGREEEVVLRLVKKP